MNLEKTKSRKSIDNGADINDNYKSICEDTILADTVLHLSFSWVD
jgi:hypothetical protein